MRNRLFWMRVTFIEVETVELLVFVWDVEYSWDM